MQSEAKAETRIFAIQRRLSLGAHRARLFENLRYDGITDVRVPSDSMWKPDVLLYNSVDSNFDSTFKTNLVVYSDGTVNWIPPGIFQISCKIDIRWFPFDEQRCFFKVATALFCG